VCARTPGLGWLINQGSWPFPCQSPILGTLNLVQWWTKGDSNPPKTYVPQAKKKKKDTRQPVAPKNYVCVRTRSLRPKSVVHPLRPLDTDVGCYDQPLEGLEKSGAHSQRPHACNLSELMVVGGAAHTHTHTHTHHFLGPLVARCCLFFFFAAHMHPDCPSTRL